MGRLYSKMKVFHFSGHLDALHRQSRRIRAPLHIRIKPTNVCSHRCWYCSYRLKGVQLGKDMSPRDSIPKEKMLEIIGDLDEMGVKAVTFSGGGDPFCYPHLLEAAKKLALSRVKFSSLTNGSRLRGEVAEVFARHATWLRISIDGWDDASYARYRGVPEGEFSRVLANMRDFVKLGGGCYLGVSLVIDKDNAPHIYETTRKLRDIGVNSVKMSPCVTSNSGRQSNEYHQPFYRVACEQIERAVSDFSGGDFTIFDSYHLLEDKFAKDYHWCPILQLNPVIGADLNVYACHDKAYNLDTGLLGSIKERGFKEFWMADKEKFFNIDPSRDCRHHCLQNATNKMILEYLDLHRDHLEFI